MVIWHHPLAQRRLSTGCDRMATTPPSLSTVKNKQKQNKSIFARSVSQHLLPRSVFITFSRRSKDNSRPPQRPTNHATHQAPFRVLPVCLSVCPCLAPPSAHPISETKMSQGARLFTRAMRNVCWHVSMTLLREIGATTLNMRATLFREILKFD